MADDNATPTVMPAAFIGHGNPMNALELNRYTASWRAFGAAVPRPRAILVVSAHWYVRLWQCARTRSTGLGSRTRLFVEWEALMEEDQVTANLSGMDDLDFIGWNNADWDGVFAEHHTDDVLVDWKEQAPTRGIQQHIEAMKAYVESAGGTPPRIAAHPIRFGSGEWTCVVGEFEGGGRMVTVAKWRNGAIAEEYIWS
jgi:hypothetical protein